jgi:hypothetical protein
MRGENPADPVASQGKSSSKQVRDRSQGAEKKPLGAGEYDLAPRDVPVPAEPRLHVRLKGVQYRGYDTRGSDESRD